ncbi:hypothetical protein RI367_007506 [Sorochytrium milnesiophthora]
MSKSQPSSYAGAREEDHSDGDGIDDDELPDASAFLSPSPSSQSQQSESQQQNKRPLSPTPAYDRHGAFFSSSLDPSSATKRARSVAPLSEQKPKFKFKPFGSATSAQATTHNAATSDGQPLPSARSVAPPPLPMMVRSPSNPFMEAVTPPHTSSQSSQPSQPAATGAASQKSSGGALPAVLKRLHTFDHRITRLEQEYRRSHSSASPTRSSFATAPTHTLDVPPATVSSLLSTLKTEVAVLKLDNARLRKDNDALRARCDDSERRMAVLGARLDLMEQQHKNKQRN